MRARLSEAREIYGSRRAARAASRRVEALNACRLAAVVRGVAGAFDPAEVGRWVGWAPPGRRRLMELSGGARAVLGGVGEVEVPSGAFGAWTPGFARGLVDSGALRRVRRGVFEAFAGRPWLESDLLSMPVAGRLGRANRLRGTRRLHGFWLGEAGRAASRDSVGYVAGLFAGARAAVVGGEEWLWLPGRCRAVLQAWGVCHTVDRRERARGRLLVSPFWGALFRGLMPPGCGARACGFRRPGGCPALPACMWGVAMAGWRGMSAALCGDLLPYCCGGRNLYKIGLTRGGLAKAAFDRFGVTSVRDEVRGLMAGWAEGACQGCGGRACGGISKKALDVPQGE